MRIWKPIIGVAVLLALALPMHFIFAHAEISESNPGPGETVERLTAIEINFTEPIQNPEIFLIQGSTRFQVVIEGGSSAPSTFVRGIPLEALEDGVYQVVWSADSIDGHTITGSYSFEIGSGTSSTTDNEGSGFNILWLVPFALVIVVGGGLAMWRWRARQA